MSDLFWLSKPQFAKIAQYFPLAHGVPRVDDLGLFLASYL